MIPYLVGAVIDYPIVLTIGNAQIAVNVARTKPSDTPMPIQDADLPDSAMAWIANTSPTLSDLQSLTWRASLASTEWSRANGSLWVRLKNPRLSKKYQVRIKYTRSRVQDRIYLESEWQQSQSSFFAFSDGGFQYARVRGRNFNPPLELWKKVTLESGGGAPLDYTLAQLSTATEIEVVQRGTMAYGNGDEIPHTDEYPERAGTIAWLKPTGERLVEYDLDAYTSDVSHGARVFQYSVSAGKVIDTAVDNFSSPHYVGLSYFRQPETVDLQALTDSVVWADLRETDSGLSVFESEEGQEFAGGIESYAELTLRYDPRYRFISRVVDDVKDESGKGREWNVNATRLSPDRRFIHADLVRSTAFA